MTLEHHRGLWGFGVSTIPSLAGRQLALQTRRIFPIARTGTSGERIRAYAYPWPLATDDYGVAFPSDLVGVALVYGRTGGGSYDAQAEAYWLANTHYFVPGILPGAYTPRLVRDWHSGEQQSTALKLARVRDADGYAPVSASAGLWLPAGPAVGTTPTISGSYQGYISPGGAFHVGWRNLAIRVGVSMTTGGGWSTSAGSVTIRVSHNADGSDVGTSGVDGDTIDGDLTWSHSDFVDSGGGQWFTNWQSLTDVLAADGVPTSFTMRDLTTTGSVITFDHPSPSTTTRTVSIWQTRQSPRADVPFPFTCTGLDDLIAPGGVI